MIVITCYCLIKYFTHLEVLNGHLSVLTLLHLSALFDIADHFFLLETCLPLVSRTARYLPHWSRRGLLFWFFLIFLTLVHSRNVSLDLFSSLSILIPLMSSCSPVVLNNIHTLTTSQLCLQLSLLGWTSDSQNLTSYLTSPYGYTEDILRLARPKWTPPISPKTYSAEFPIAVNGNSILVVNQVKNFESFLIPIFLSHSLLTASDSLCWPSLNYLQNPITSHHIYCHHPGLSHYPLSDGWLQQPSIWPPCFQHDLLGIYTTQQQSGSVKKYVKYMSSLCKIFQWLFISL